VNCLQHLTPKARLLTLGHCLCRLLMHDKLRKPMSRFKDLRAGRLTTGAAQGGFSQRLRRITTGRRGEAKKIIRPGSRSHRRLRDSVAHDQDSNLISVPAILTTPRKTS